MIPDSVLRPHLSLFPTSTSSVTSSALRWFPLRPLSRLLFPQLQDHLMTKEKSSGLVVARTGFKFQHCHPLTMKHWASPFKHMHLLKPHLVLERMQGVSKLLNIRPSVSSSLSEVTWRQCGLGDLRSFQPYHFVTDSNHLLVISS